MSVEWLIDCLFPKRCPVCKDVVIPKESGICPACRKKWKPILEPRCKKCGRVVEEAEQEYCFDCSHSPKSFQQAITLLDYSVPWVKDMIMQVKYYNRRQYLDYPCKELARQYRETINRWNADAIIPVPLHPSRKRKRGFNQAEEIAARLEKEWNIPMDCHILMRTKKTAPQKELSNKQRLKNLEQAFEAGDGKNYKNVILADDIYTTGSTAEACTRVLNGAGIHGVYVVTIAAGRGI